MSKERSAIHWFRKGLRLHDNPALLEACKKRSVVYPVFILDPWFAKPSEVGQLRYAFLLESLRDIDTSLKKLGTRLYVVKGKPEDKLPELFKDFHADLLTFEADSEPYAVKRDGEISRLARQKGVEVSVHHSHTLRELEYYLALTRGECPSTYQAFCKLHSSAGKVRNALEAPSAADMPTQQAKASSLDDAEYDVPLLTDMGYEALAAPLKFPGGETEALRRMTATCEDRPKWVATFEKPKTLPTATEPATTVLSPYLKFGCLSAARFYHVLAGIYAGKAGHTQPPVSLHGQLLWREFFYLNCYAVPNFGNMVGNPRCKQIPWDHDDEKLTAWKEARTGYPWIDACMTQLRTEGWLHHLGRHSVACFLTRGDLFQHWEAGAKVFELFLLDADYSINRANWQWLSCSNFFYQYFRCYSPVAFAKKSDKSGAYIRKYLPALRKMPEKYIYEPWAAPIAVQRQAGCVVGTDYPDRICIHEDVSKENMARIKAAYDAEKAMKGKGDSEPLRKKAKTA